MKPGRKPYPWNHIKTIARFWSFCWPDPDSDCLLFHGSLTNGWGRFRAMGFPGNASGRVLAHRYVWALQHGPIAAGHDVHHSHTVCVNRNCVLPDHLESIDHDEHAGISIAFRWAEDPWAEPAPPSEF